MKPLPNQPLLRLPQSPLQGEMRALNGVDGPADDQKALLFYSPFDKPGLVFHSAQNHTRLVADRLPEAFMLGRSGLGSTNENGTQGSGTQSAASSYHDAGASVQVRAFLANAGNDDQDLWHVTLFGWVLPGMQSISRATYEWNQTSWLGSRTVGVMDEASNIQETTSGQLTPIWQAIGEYVRTGKTPTRAIGVRPGMQFE